MSKFQIIEINSLKEIDKIKNDWYDLLNTLPTNNIYTDPDFFYRLFNSRAKNAIPHIVLFKKNDKVKAILIGWKTNIRIPIWLGYIKFDSSELKALEIEIDGLLTDGDEESKVSVVNYLNSLLKKQDIELLIANHFSSQNIFYDVLTNGLENRKAIYRPGLEWTSIIRDSETGEAANFHNAWTGQTFRRKDRKILKYFDQKLEVKLFQIPDDVKIFIEHAEKISKKSYHVALGVGIQNNDYWNKLFLAMAEGGYFRGYLLMSGEIPIAYYQGAEYKDVFYAFTTAYDSDYSKLSPGSYLLRRVIDLSVKSKLNIFHFGYGDAEHKQLYGNISVDESSFKIYGSSFSAKFVRFLDSSTLFINETILGFLKRRGWLNKIKKIWRSKLAKK